MKRKIEANFLALQSALTHLSYLYSVKYDLNETALNAASDVPDTAFDQAIFSIQNITSKIRKELSVDTKEMLKRFDKIVGAVSLLTRVSDKDMTIKKSNNKLWAYFIDISMFCIHLDGLMLQKNVSEQVLDESDTLNRLNSLEKSWKRIDLSKGLTLTEEEKNNILTEIDKSLTNLSDVQITIKDSTYAAKEEILSGISKNIIHLNELKEKIL